MYHLFLYSISNFVSNQTEKKAFLLTVSLNPRYDNPKLNYLKELITKIYSEKPDSRGIIFCKTREMTVALTKWMNETPGLDELNPHNLVGSNAPSQSAG